jgi:hypothetical protein
MQLTSTLAGLICINRSHEDNKMLKKFKQFLIEQRYSEVTPLGHPSTVYDYERRINRICIRENISIIELSGKIKKIVEKYGPSGIESDYGKQSHGAYIAALNRFNEFVNNSAKKLKS